MAIVALCAAACATPAEPTPPPSTLRAAAYYPLAVGNRWSYDVTPAPPDKATQEVRILDVDQAGYFVDTQGGKLAPRSDGIFDGRRFLLQDPIAVDHAWMAVTSPAVVENYRISAVGTSVSVVAGNFVDCVAVESSLDVTHPQTKQLGRLTTTWTYAPGVGLVRLRQTFQSGSQPAQQVTSMELHSYELQQPR